MKRGEIYYLTISEGTTTGCEIKYDRPAIVVSCDNLASSGSTVTVVPCSSSPRYSSREKEMRCHIAINSTSRPCHAIVEQITTVDKSRLDRCLGSVTLKELEAIDAALMDCLALPSREGERENTTLDLRTEPAAIVPRDECPSEGKDYSAQFVPKAADKELDALRAELAVYKHLYADLLGRVVKTA